MLQIIPCVIVRSPNGEGVPFSAIYQNHSWSGGIADTFQKAKTKMEERSWCCSGTSGVDVFLQEILVLKGSWNEDTQKSTWKTSFIRSFVRRFNETINCKCDCRIFWKGQETLMMARTRSISIFCYTGTRLYQHPEERAAIVCLFCYTGDCCCYSVPCAEPTNEINRRRFAVFWTLSISDL